jgi:imidazolonepropionase-like amidohydrolase
MAEAGTVNCPTLVVLERYSRAGLDELAEDPRVAQMSAYLRSWWGGQFASFKASWGSEYRKTAQAALAKRLEFVKMLHDAGAPLILGTDTPNPYVVPGDSVHDELALLVRAGLTPKDALLAAGAQAAEAMGAEAEIGTLDAGKIADLVVLERDPLADIANTRTIAAVIHRGVLRTRGQLAPRAQAAEQR